MKFNELDLVQNSPEWETWRNQGIGASDAPTIMRENKFKSPGQLLHEKKNSIRPRKNIKMITGSKLEGRARLSYIRQFSVQVSPLCVESIDYPWLRASLDGISEDRSHLVEIKCGESAYNQARRRIVPKYYYGQLQHQLMLTGLNTIQYWCFWTTGPGIRIPVQRNDQYIKRLFAEEEKFFNLLTTP
ncbi:YqaJ viral recombinase family protein [bacterium]|nr:YqaJ viral recombinase family protein [bacterium]